jgi:SAM-dependent methyltransferase
MEMIGMVPERKISRVSDGKLIELFTLGELYLSDFIDDNSPAPVKVPLTLALDKKSGLVQLKHTAPFDKMYNNYWYRSGMNKTMTEELRGISQKAASLVGCGAGDVVLDIGCNDGTLLSFYPKDLYRVGFDPAQNLRQYSKKNANLIVTDFFTAQAYFNQLKKKAKIITSIAIFYDMEDPHKFVADLESVLDDNGLWILQMSYLPLMLKQIAFDNICHEHLEYYSLSSLNYVIEKHRLEVVDVELNDINGGSYRVYIRKKGADERLFANAPYRDVAGFRIAALQAYEKSLKLADPATYAAWFKKVLELKEKTIALIKAEKAKGKSIWGYGASTKGNTLLQFFNLDSALITAIAERNPDKFGKRTVGTNIPITSEAEMRKAQPGYLLILPWHFVSEFREREKPYLLAGGKFIVPCPKFEVISVQSS